MNKDQPEQTSEGILRAGEVRGVGACGIKPDYIHFMNSTSRPELKKASGPWHHLHLYHRQTDEAEPVGSIKFFDKERSTYEDNGGDIICWRGVGASNQTTLTS